MHQEAWERVRAVEEARNTQFASIQEVHERELGRMSDHAQRMESEHLQWSTVEQEAFASHKREVVEAQTEFQTMREELSVALADADCIREQHEGLLGALRKEREQADNHFQTLLYQ